MNKILQQKIEEAAKTEPWLSEEAFVNGCEFILNNLWISVEEALPEFEGNFSDYYIIRTEKGLCAVTMYYRTSQEEYWWNFEEIKVTHWMEIPKLNSDE